MTIDEEPQAAQPRVTVMDRDAAKSRESLGPRAVWTAENLAASIQQIDRLLSMAIAAK